MNFKNIILFEDNHLLIVNKPAGILVQSDKDNSDKNIEEWAKQYIKVAENKQGNVFLGIPHRIDRPTSGIVILCKSSKSLVRVNDMFQKKTIVKTYWAIVEKKDIPSEGQWTHYLKRSSKENISLVSNSEKPDYKEAKLSYKILNIGKTSMLLEIYLHTGRHHQIRAQFSSMGLPIYGDNKYGFKRGLPDKSIALHSRKVEFIHPVTAQKIELIAPTRDETIWKVHE